LSTAVESKKYAISRKVANGMSYALSIFQLRAWNALMIQTELWLGKGLPSIARSDSCHVAFLGTYNPRYYSLGSEDAPPVLLVPGLAGGLELGLPFAKRLSRHFRVVIFQPRGEDCAYDLSPRASLADLAQDLLAFQDHLRLERPLLFGYSFGGAVALQAASLAPGRVNGVVVQGVGPSFPPTALQRVAGEVLEHIYLPHNNGFINQFFHLLFGTRWVLPELLESVIERCWQTDQGVMARRFQMIREFKIEPLVEGLRQVPLLIQTAANDVIVSPEAWRPWRRVLPRMTLQRIENAGHLAFLTHAETLADQIERFASRRLGVAPLLSA
jgi:pimeloyl-ACP methyl ester carboxylesterase